MPLIQVNLIEGVFSNEQKQEMVRKLTDAMVSIAKQETVVSALLWTMLPLPRPCWTTSVWRTRRTTSRRRERMVLLSLSDTQHRT